MRIIQISVDLSEAWRCLIHVKVQLPVQPDTRAIFTTPLWIQESHKDNGPVAGIAGLYFFCYHGRKTEKQQLRWQRVPRAPSQYCLDIPPGVDTIHAHFDAVITRNVTRRVVLFGWESALLYPVGRQSIHKIPIQASVTVPNGWGVATALQNLGDPVIVPSIDKGPYAVKTHHFHPTTVALLADCPVLAGVHLCNYTLTDSKGEILCLAADREDDTQVSPQVLSKLSTLVNQTLLLFGPRPSSGKFFFLVALSDFLPGVGGSEHFDSCAIVLRGAALANPKRMRESIPILAHEFIHPWNGKYRRPEGHNPPNFSTPLDGKLLWVYEGLTQYYEAVLSARAGVLSKQEFLGELARKLAWLESQSGREWRSVEDTGTGVSLTGRGMAWSNWTRERDDYYFEGALVWLDVDILLRSISGGRKSLDDFVSAFFRVREVRKDERFGNSMPVMEYTLEDIVKALDGILPDYGWNGLFLKRIVEVAPEVDMDGIKQAGYRFFYTREPTLPPATDTSQKDPEGQDEEWESKHGKAALKEAIWNSLGVQVSDDGRVEDVRRGGPADIAGLAPRQTIISAYGNHKPGCGRGGPTFNVWDLARDINKADEKGGVRLRIAQEMDRWEVNVDYHGGLRYPRLEKIGGTVDVLECILQPSTGGN